ncbi:uncharacterized, partial [Tachysurus ichikawai]
QCVSDSVFCCMMLGLCCDVLLQSCVR